MNQTASISLLRSAARLFVVLFSASALSGCYFTHVAAGQLHVITASVSIKSALNDQGLSASDKEKLVYIQEVKAFAEQHLHLKRTCNYSTYLPGNKEPLTYVVTAAEKTSLTPVTWWYPIVGTASYKGFFDLKEAQEEQRELEGAGYDTQLRSAGGYSTLGWFCDPVLPTMLDRDYGDLAALIIHELTHSTVYVPGETDYNESLANFVARHGAPLFLDAKFGQGNPHTAALLNSLHLSEELDAYMRQLAEELKAVYECSETSALHLRAEVFARATSELGQICLDHGYNADSCLPDGPMNNAVVLSRLTYGSPAPFEKLFKQVGGSWPHFISALCAEHEDNRWYPQ